MNSIFPYLENVYLQLFWQAYLTDVRNLKLLQKFHLIHLVHLNLFLGLLVGKLLLLSRIQKFDLMIFSLTLMSFPIHRSVYKTRNKSVITPNNNGDKI